MERVSDPYLEFFASMVETGNYLLKYHHALFHSVSFIWNGLAWLITAPSGTGKTTQLKHWGKMFGKEIRVINGDKSVLECRTDGSVYVSSSPWTGKEGIGFNNRSAKLGGIILLEQSDHNEIYLMNSHEAVIPLFYEFISYPEHAEQLRMQAEMLDQILNAAPVWKLLNIGNRDSVLLTKKELERFLREEKQNVSD